MKKNEHVNITPRTEVVSLSKCRDKSLSFKTSFQTGCALVIETIKNRWSIVYRSTLMIIYEFVFV